MSASGIQILSGQDNAEQRNISALQLRDRNALNFGSVLFKDRDTGNKAAPPNKRKRRSLREPCPCRKPYEVGHSIAPPALLTSEERDRLEAVL